jgi:hypothetical protein
MERYTPDRPVCLFKHWASVPVVRFPPMFAIVYLVVLYSFVMSSVF